MPSDTDIKALLYAILKQKCLKDIDWNKVARDPVLTQSITNGHAARMRYSRFKKQMDALEPGAVPAPVHRRPRNNASSLTSASPKRTRIEKNRSPKKVKRGSVDEGDSGIKSEDRNGEGSEREMEREGTVDSTADMGMSMSMSMSTSMENTARVKRERSYGHGRAQAQSGEGSLMTPLPSTPRYCIERSTSPSPSHDHDHNPHQDPHQNLHHGHSQSPSQGHSFNSMHVDGFVSSFGIVSGTESEGLFGEVIPGNEVFGMGVGLHSGMGGLGMVENSFDSCLWDPSQSMHSQSHSQVHVQSQNGQVGSGSGNRREGGVTVEGGVLVKTEPRWEEAYRHV